MRMFSNPQLFLLRIPAILLALTIHEYAHGFIARLRGDPSAEEAGRLTLNPFSHLDILGTAMLLFGPFGWAKPVPVTPGRLHSPRRDLIWVSAAGPVSNILLAIVFGLALRILRANGIALHPQFAYFLQVTVIINLGLSFFNLIPVPPLDGSNILRSLLPPDKVGAYLKIARHGATVFLVLIVAQYVLRRPLFSMVISPVWTPYYSFWQWVIFGGAM